MDCEPVIGIAPDQPPEAAQLAAFAADHCSVELAPFAMVLGLAARLIVGAGAGEETETLAVWLALPPAPEQVME